MYNEQCNSVDSNRINIQNSPSYWHRCIVQCCHYGNYLQMMVL